MTNQSQIVYIRETTDEALPPALRGQVDKVFSLHDAESGRQLAVTADRNLAFALARQHDMTALSVH